MKTRARLGDIAEVTIVDSRDDRSVRARIRDNAPHAHYALEREDIRAELSAFAAVCEHIGVQPQWDVWEPFGGSGWHTAIIQAIVKPDDHQASDINSDCTASIAMSCDSARVVPRTEDSFRRLSQFSAATNLRRFDWVHADFNLWTIEHLSDSLPLRKAFHGLFGAATELITFTDTTPYTLYQPEYDIQSNEWFHDLGRWIRALFGWHLEATFTWGPAAMHVLRREPSERVRSLHGPFQPMLVTILEQTE